MGFPLMVRAIRLSIEAVDRGSRTPPARSAPARSAVFATVTAAADACPASSPARSCAFAKALGEFGATITFVSNIPGETQTLPLGDLHLDAGARRRGRRRCG